jgi:putative mycofactocin binding protein MftB
VSGSAAPALAAPAAFDPARPWRLDPQVALRDEAFGALVYHYGNRRLIFLRSRALVELVRSLERFDSANAALEACVAEPDRRSHAAALERLASSEVIGVR